VSLCRLPVEYLNWGYGVRTRIGLPKLLSGSFGPRVERGVFDVTSWSIPDNRGQPVDDTAFSLSIGVSSPNYRCSAPPCPALLRGSLTTAL
jgi:hypothetical protein